MFVFNILLALMRISTSLPQAKTEDEFNDPVAVMRCVNGSVRMRSPSESDAYFVPIIEDCRKIPNGRLYIHAYWSCMLSQMGLAEEYKKPTLDTLANFYCRMFSNKILDEIPTYKRQLRECAEHFVDNYDRAGEEKQYLLARFLNCSVANLFSQMGSAALRVCEPSMLETELVSMNRSTFFYCENTRLEGKESLQNFINGSMDSNCTVPESYKGAVKAIGIITKDGTSTLRKVRKFLDFLYPAAVLEVVPRFTSAVLHCGNAFVRSLMEGGDTDGCGAKTFIECFWSEHNKFQPEFDVACGKASPQTIAVTLNEMRNASVQMEGNQTVLSKIES